MKAFFFLCLLSIAFNLSAQWESKNRQFDAFLRQGMQEWNVPGMAVVVVREGKVVFKQCYGRRSMGQNAPVDSLTLFGMASTSKALTAMAMGVLVDQKKVDWNDPVVKHLPDFALSEPYLTAHTRVRDLFTHSLGTQNTDKIWVWDSTDNRTMMQRYARVPIELEWRGSFNYQNIPYIIAGELIARKSGMSFGAFVEQHVFAPIGMSHSAGTAERALRHGNYAVGHIDHHTEGLAPLPVQFYEQVGGAGGLWSCAEDIGRYLQFITNKGNVNGKAILQPATFEYLFSPQVVITNSGYSMLKSIPHHWVSYGLGWFQHDYRNEKLDYHTGSLAGLNAITGVMHDRKTAVYFFANASNAALRYAALYKAMDLYAFGDEAGRDWLAVVRQHYAGSKERQAKSEERRENERRRGTRPRFALQDYTGTYTHPVFGEVHIRLEDGALRLVHNQGYVRYQLTHWQDETFQSSRNELWLYRISVRFVAEAGQKRPARLIYYDPNIQVEFARTE